MVGPFEALRGLDGPIEPHAEFSEALLALCLAELRPQTRQGMLTRWSRLQMAVAVALFALALAAVATATYLALRRSAARPVPKPAQLTVIKQPNVRGPAGLAQIAVIDSLGKEHTVWECPERIWCGTLTSLAWSQDGRRLAIAFGEIGGRSGYVGLHVIDLATGVDRQLGALPIAHLERPQPMAVLGRLVAATTKALGCSLPNELAWAPDSTRIAYVCDNDPFHIGGRTSIYVIRPDGTGRVRVRTGTFTAYWPSWSPDGKRIAFATRAGLGPADSAVPSDSTVYTVRLDGSGRRLVAHEASEPAWSPDGKTIAYHAPCGIRLVTPTGAPVRPPRFPACLFFFLLGGLPAWSPDGGQLAIETHGGIYVVYPNGGRRRRRLTTATGLGDYGVGSGLGRSAWAPAQALALLVARRHQAGL
jgi:dipeptidyl aminopeptidase/acylaminoacyl peptidase